VEAGWCGSRENCRVLVDAERKQQQDDDDRRHDADDQRDPGRQRADAAAAARPFPSAGGRPVRRRDSAGRADTLSAAQSADDGRSGSQSDVDDVLSDCRITGRLQPVNQSVSP